MLSLKTPEDYLQEITAHIKTRRLAQNLTQTELAKRSDVSLATLRQFEHSGKIAFTSFIRLAFVLGCTEALSQAVAPNPIPVSLFDETYNRNKARKRATRKER